MREGMLYEKTGSGKVRCGLCAHRCTIAEGKTGICRVRRNIDGTLYSLVYDRVAALHVDPIEKKPLFHFYPGSRSLSLAAMGCNFHCLNCQNYQISQVKDEADIQGEVISPSRIAGMALAEGCPSISYTYTEPTVYFELAYDTAAIAKEKGIANVFVSNGYMTAEALNAISPFLDAINIDLKFFRDETYKKICGAGLDPVLSTIRLCHDLGIWVEVTTLVIPGLNDDEEQLAGIARFIASVDPSIPWHLSRFYPTYRMTDRDCTPESTLRRALQIGKENGLSYIYEGNVPGRGGESTLCPSCGKVLISRSGFSVMANSVVNGLCPSCGLAVAGRGL